MRRGNPLIYSAMVLHLSSAASLGAISQRSFPACSRDPGVPARPRQPPAAAPEQSSFWLVGEGIADANLASGILLREPAVEPAIVIAAERARRLRLIGREVGRRSSYQPPWRHTAGRRASCGGGWPALDGL
jgi:hypothetical protein